MDFLDILREKAFIGREFLTWLWFKSDRTGGRVEIGGGRTAEVIFLDRMKLDLSDAEASQTVTVTGEHSELREGVAALKEGKKIEEARISVRVGDNDYAVLLKGTWLMYGSFRTPPVLPPEEPEVEEEREGALLEKAYMIEEGMGIIDDLFRIFIELRISDDWEAKELPEIRDWIRKTAP